MAVTRLNSCLSNNSVSLFDRFLAHFVFQPTQHDEATLKEFKRRHCVKLVEDEPDQLLVHTFNQSKTVRCVLFLHGNATDILSVVPLAAKISAALHCDVIVPEYPGYSVRNSEAPSEHGIYRAAENAYRFITDEWGSAPVVMGQSLGSGPAVHLACMFSIPHLVLISGFTSVQSVLDNAVGSLATLLPSTGMFNNLAKIDRVRCPVLAFHGRKDMLVPHTHAVELWRRKKDISLYTLHDCDHNHIPWVHVLRVIRLSLDLNEINSK
jgi:pimeloyl-ACP methyl ester carboxylesterase